MPVHPRKGVLRPSVPPPGLRPTLPRGERAVTVCIEAICNLGPDRPACVVAACNRMITIGGLRHEPQQRKAVELGSTPIAPFPGTCSCMQRSRQEPSIG